MARRYDPYDEEYEQTAATDVPFAPAVPVASVPTYTPDMYDYQFAPTPAMIGGGSAGFQPWSNIGRKTTTGMQDRWDPFGNEDPFGGGMVPAGAPQTQTLSPYGGINLDAGLPSNILPNLSQFAGGAAAAPTFSPAFSAAPTTAPATTPAPPPAAFPTAAPATTPAAGTGTSVIPSAFDLEELGGGFGQFDPLLSNVVNQYTAPLQAGAFMEPAPDVTGRVQDLLTTGGLIPSSLQTFGAGLAGLPTGGAAPTQDILSQFISGTAGGADIPVQNVANQQLQNLMQGAGISPEYAQAARETIFDPSMEAIQGRINKMGGGVADLTGGLSQELQRRHERDFMNQMLMAGERNLPTYLQLGLAGGGQQAEQALNAAQLAAARETGLGAFGTGGVQTGMDFMKTLGQQRLGQQEQLSSLLEAIMSGALTERTGIWPYLLQAAGAAAPGILKVLFPDPPKKTPPDPAPTKKAPIGGQTKTWEDILKDTVQQGAGGLLGGIFNREQLENDPATRTIWGTPPFNPNPFAGIGNIGGFGLPF